MNSDSELDRDFFAIDDNRAMEAAEYEPSASNEPNTEADHHSPREFRVGNVLGGVDDRKRVQNTLQKPFRWVCQILAQSNRVLNGQRAAGSGFVIGERTILTAAHNLFVLGHRANRFEISLAANGIRSSAPLGQYICTQAVHHPLYQSSQSRFDLAVIHLDQPLRRDLLPVPARYGTLPIVGIDSSVIHGISGWVVGYPKKYPDHEASSLPRPENGVQAYQYYCESDLRYDHAKQVISYELDTGGGQSGSPLVTVHQGPDGRSRSVAIGIHVEGGNDLTGNFAVPLESEQIAFVLGELDRVRPRIT